MLKTQSNYGVIYLIGQCLNNLNKWKAITEDASVETEGDEFRYLLSPHIRVKREGFHFANNPISLGVHYFAVLSLYQLCLGVLAWAIASELFCILVGFLNAKLCSNVLGYILQQISNWLKIIRMLLFFLTQELLEVHYPTVNQVFSNYDLFLWARYLSVNVLYHHECSVNSMRKDWRLLLKAFLRNIKIKIVCVKHKVTIEAEKILIPNVVKR